MLRDGDSQPLPPTSGLLQLLDPGRKHSFKSGSLKSGDINTSYLNAAQQIQDVVEHELSQSMQHIEDPQSLALVQELKIFSAPVLSIEFSKLFAVWIHVLKEAAVLCNAVIGSFILSVGGFICLNIVGNPLMQASFGIFQSCNLILFESPLISMADKIGIDFSVAFGSGDALHSRKVFSQGTLTLLMSISIFSVPALLSIEYLLLLLGIDPENARVVQECCYPFIIAAYVETIAEILRTFCLSQGMESALGKIALANNLFSILTNWFFIVYWNLGPKGWVYANLVFQLVNLLSALWVMRSSDPAYIGFVSFGETMKGFGPYFLECVKFMLGSYCEFIGFELTSIYIARLRNNNYIGAYTAMVNFSSMAYKIGQTLAIACRTRVNVLIGLKLYKTAQHFYAFFVSAACGIGVFVGVIIYLCSSYIADLYANSNQIMRQQFEYLLYVYAISAPSEISLYISYVGMKTTGNMTKLLLLNVGIVIGLNSTIGLYLAKHNASPALLFFFLMSLLWVVNLSSALIAIRSDWSQARSDEEDAIVQKKHASSNDGQPKELKEVLIDKKL